MLGVINDQELVNGKETRERRGGRGEGPEWPVLTHKKRKEKRRYIRVDTYMFSFTYLLFDLLLVQIRLYWNI